MIAGIGLDLVEVERIRDFHRRWGDTGLRRLFSAGELDYCMGLVDPAPSLAARFAAKEAFFKAVGIGWGPGGAFAEVEVRRGATGDPDLVLTGRAAESASDAGIQAMHVTLTHTAGSAAAVVILER